MCGATSAVGLEEAERAVWPVLRERLREPGRLMGLMRGVLGGDAEVAVVVATTPSGITSPLAIVVTSMIAAEIEVLEDGSAGLRRGRIGEDEVDLLMGSVRQGPPEPLAVLTTGWMREHLSLYARELWHRPNLVTAAQHALRGESAATAGAGGRGVAGLTKDLGDTP